jgi:hypothetical protein
MEGGEGGLYSFTKKREDKKRTHRKNQEYFSNKRPVSMLSHRFSDDRIKYKYRSS